MNTHTNTKDGVERGSAMVIAVLVMAIMSLLGISYLLMADTENRIAENEKLSAQALYFGEGVVREVKRWFDRPPYGVNGTKSLVKPTTAVLDRTHRLIGVDPHGPTDYVAADGTTAHPYYKVGVDRDADGNDDIFDKPYRSGLADMLVGTEEGPDIRIDWATGGATATFLDALRDKISPNWPAGAAGILTRVKKVEVYAPPYLDIGGTWTRYGMATVKVTVQVVKTVGGADQILAERVVKAVLNETPFPGPYGPLHSCEELVWNGEFSTHWGAVSAVGPDSAGGDISLPNNWTNKLNASIPRATPPSPKLDLLYGYDNDTNFAAMKTALQAKSIPDPWFQFFAGGDVEPFKSGSYGSPQVVAPIATDVDHSNVFRQFPGGVNCPEFDYDTWKEIARSGGSDVHYFAWDNGTSFRENATGTATSFESLTDGKTGLFFFDTKDGLAPHDFNSHGVAVNLTPEIKITGNSYGARGFLYMNTLKWTSTGNPGKTITMHWPGEPFQDKNQNGVYDSGEGWINLNYAGTGPVPVISTTDPHAAPKASSADAYGGSVTWNNRGPDITGQNAVVWGLLYVSGDFDAQGTPLYYGSVITKSGNDGTMAGTPDLFWDTDLKDNWPPPTWDLPRVVITRWETDL
jgi:hypothetical protein